MKPEIENLKVWMSGRSTTGYQRALAMREFEQLLTYVSELEQLRQPHVPCRFSINKTILSDFALFAIVDNELNKVVCHLVYDNGEEYCEEMANKMLAGLNGG